MHIDLWYTLYEIGGDRMKRLIAPVVITILMVLILVCYALACLIVDFFLYGKIMGILVCIALVGVSVYVLIERINEIRSGEEDDLSKY